MTKVYKCSKIHKVCKVEKSFRAYTHNFRHSRHFSYTLQLSTWCLGLLTVVTLFLAIGCQKQKPLPDTLSLEMDTRNGQPLRQALYGFNSNMISGDYGYLDDDFVACDSGTRTKDFTVSRRKRLGTSIIGNLAAFLRAKWHQPSV